MGFEKKPDTEEACNLIRFSREYSRKFLKTKTVRIPLELDEEGVFRFNSNVIMIWNLRTNNISFDFDSLACNHRTIHLTTNKPLRCTNQHALDMLYKRRKHALEYNKQRLKNDPKKVRGQNDASKLRKILREHEDEFINDPESLSTDFIINLVNGVHK